MSSKIIFALCLLVSSVSCLVTIQSAPQVFHNRANFVAAISSGYYEETYDGFTLNADGASSLSETHNGYQVDGLVKKYAGGNAAFYVCHASSDRWIQSYNDTSVDYIEFVFSGTLPKSVGAHFFASNYLCTNAVNGKIIVELGGVNYTLTASSTSQYLGIKSATPFTGMRVFGSTLVKNYCITLNDLILADGVSGNPCGNHVLDAGEDCDTADPSFHCSPSCHCQQPWYDCNENPADGCEVNLSDPHSCGTCANNCFTKGHVINAECDSGKCVVLQCDTIGGTWSDCNIRGFDGCEINLDVNVLNCGVCRSPCPGTYPNANATTCQSGQCDVFSCIQGYADCNGIATDGCEVSLFDVHSCGSCNIDCTTKGSHIVSTSCGTDSLCHVTSCASGFGDCDLLAYNGCEANLLNTVAHCGVCANSCSIPHANSRCVNGICAIANCLHGFCDLDHVLANGCEAVC